MMAHFRNTLLATTALMPLGIMTAAGNPLGSQVVGGSANVQGQGTSRVTVTQSSDKAVINWQTFNIGSGEATQFVQPSASSITLNRVTGNMGASVLDGTLTANGRVFLVNPDGILFGAGSKINTGSFLATTNDIRNGDFMAGRYQFNIPGRSDASIVNLGTITAQNGGFAALVAPGVRNTGTITANLGTVGLAASNNFSLDFYGDRLITLGINDSIAAKVIDVATGKPLNALVQNDGELRANGGRVELTAAAARQVVDSVINNTGVIEANSIGSKNGMIVLGAATAATKPAGAPPQTIKLSGAISAAGKRKSTKGGTVVVSGENIQLTSATIDASGQAGGGKILIGGDVGGGKGNAAVAKNPKAALESFAIATASTVSVDATTIINASAKGTGDGGKVVVWSDQVTNFFGTIKAQGGQQSGNGGLVETSGRQSLTFDGTVDTGAPRGTNGTLLLDPLDAKIDTNPGTGVITVSAIQNALLSGDVIVSTSVPGGDPGNIAVAAQVTWSTPNTLTLNADNNIAINAALSGPNGGLTINAGSLGFVGSITATAPINVGIFTLQNGAWSQVGANLPSFFASDFRIGNSSGPPGFSSVSFLRALGGNGTSSSPYLIADIYGLQGIGAGQNVVLANNIEASGTASWNGGAGFIPIGASRSSPILLQQSFSGAFDGQSHSINDLTIASSNFDVGLFAIIGSGGVARNVVIASANILATGSSNSSRDVGVLAGANEGIVTNVSVVDSNVVIPSGSAGGLVGRNNGTINQSTASGTVAANNPTVVGFVTVGGLVGSNGSGGGILPGFNTTGTIDQSSASAAVSIAGSGAVGGLVGFNGGGISQSFSTGSVHGGALVSNGFTFSSAAGGLVGQNSGTVADSNAAGAVTGDLNSTVGGLVGANTAVFGASAPSILRSYATGLVRVGDGGIAGGLAGINVGNITQTFAIGSVTGGSDSLIGGLVGINSVPFSLSGAPVTIVQSYAIGSVTGGPNSHVGGLVADNIGGTISETYAVGPVNGAGNSIVGGLLALNSPGTNVFTGATSPGVVTSSYWDSLSTGQSVSAGGTGKTTAQLIGGLPGGFDNTVWTIKPGVSYPYFPWQPVSTILIAGALPNNNSSQPTLPAGTSAYPTVQTAFFTPGNNQTTNSTPTIILTPVDTSIPAKTLIVTSSPSTNTQTKSIAEDLAVVKTVIITDGSMHVHDTTLFQNIISKLGLNKNYSTDASGYIYPSNYGTADREECVALVLALTPSLSQNTDNWTKGVQVDLNGKQNPALQPGTAIATFNPDGGYPANGVLSSNSIAHTAIFLGYGTINGQFGMYILDQYTTKPRIPGQSAEIRFDPFSATTAGEYFAIGTN